MSETPIPAAIAAVEDRVVDLVTGRLEKFRSDIQEHFSGIYNQLGENSGVVQTLSGLVSELNNRLAGLDCKAHRAELRALREALDKVTGRVDRLNGTPPDGARARPPSEGSAPVTARQLETTERTVVASIEGRVAALVTDRLQQQRDLERQADERARERIAEHLADTSAASQARWQRVQWIAGVVAALLGSGTAVSWCQLSSQRDVDRAAVVKALKAQPAPVVVRVPVPVPAPVQPREEQ